MGATEAVSTRLTKVKPFDALCGTVVLWCLQIFPGIETSLNPAVLLFS